MYKPIKHYDFISAPTNITVVGIGKEDVSEYHYDKYDAKRNKDKWFAIMLYGQLLCYHQSFMDQSHLIPTLMRFTKKAAWAVVDMFMRLNFPFPYEVCYFEYNGFMGRSDKSKRMPYNARFKQWSGDPGIALMKCSDGKERHIPTYAMKYSFITLPNDMTRVESNKTPVLFGPALKSN